VIFTLQELGIADTILNEGKGLVQFLNASNLVSAKYIFPFKKQDDDSSSNDEESDGENLTDMHNTYILNF